MTDAVPDVDPDDVDDPPDEWEAIADTIERRSSLSEMQAKVFYLHGVAGYTETDVAALLGMPVGTVRSHAGRAKDKLRKARYLVGYADEADL